MLYVTEFNEDKLVLKIVHGCTIFKHCITTSVILKGNAYAFYFLLQDNGTKSISVKEP